MALCCFLPYVNINQAWIYMICPPPSWNSLPLFTLSLSSRLSQSNELSFLSQTANCHWISILHMGMYMIPCCFLNLYPPLLPLLCRQVCSLPVTSLHLHCGSANSFFLFFFLASSDGLFHLIICIYCSPMSLHGLIAHFILALEVIPLYKCTSLCIHSPTEGYLSCFQVWTIMDKIVLNVYVQVFVWTSGFIFFG